MVSRRRMVSRWGRGSDVATGHTPAAGVSVAGRRVQVRPHSVPAMARPMSFGASSVTRWTLKLI